MHVRLHVSVGLLVSVDVVDFVHKLGFIITFFLSLQGQLLVFVFGVLLSGSCVVSDIAWIFTCEQMLTF